MADAALTHPRLVERDFAADCSVDSVEQKWSQRKTLIFVFTTSTALWSGIIYGIWQLV